jgi:hypothetical protein
MNVEKNIRNELGVVKRTKPKRVMKAQTVNLAHEKFWKQESKQNADYK